MLSRGELIPPPDPECPFPNSAIFPHGQARIARSAICPVIKGIRGQIQNAHQAEWLFTSNFIPDTGRITVHPCLLSCHRLKTIYCFCAWPESAMFSESLSSSSSSSSKSGISINCGFRNRLLFVSANFQRRQRFVIHQQIKIIASVMVSRSRRALAMRCRASAFSSSSLRQRVWASSTMRFLLPRQQDALSPH